MAEPERSVWPVMVTCGGWYFFMSLDIWSSVTFSLPLMLDLSKPK